MSINVYKPMAGLASLVYGLMRREEIELAAKRATRDMPFRLIRGNAPAIARKTARALADRQRPHSAPMVIAVCRKLDGGRKYRQCATRDQALRHGPYLIEHVNGFGQVTWRERLP